MAVNDHLLEIARIDRQLMEFVSSRPVIHINELSTYRQLKEERRDYVRAIQSYKPRGTV
jgi:hypothetical protein